MASSALPSSGEYFSGGGTYTHTITATHDSNSLLVAFFSSDVNSDTHNPSGWTQIGSANTDNGQKLTMWYKEASSSSETFSQTSMTYNANVVVFVIDDYDSMDIVNGSAVAGRSGATATSPSLTTDENNCILLHACSYDGIGTTVEMPGEAGVAVYHGVGSNTLVAGYDIKTTAGAIDTFDYISEFSYEGGATAVIAINTSSGNLPPAGRSTNITRFYGNTGETQQTTTTDMNLTDFADVTATAINGVNVSTEAPDFGGTVTDFDTNWADCSRFRWNTSEGSDTMQGVVDVPASNLDFSGKTISIYMVTESNSSTNLGDNGNIIYFEDGSNNWAAFKLIGNSDDGLFWSSGTGYTFFIDTTDNTPLDSSGTLDWSDIDKIGYAYHRKASIGGALMGFRIKHLIAHDKTELYGGHSGNPVDPTFAKTVLEGRKVYSQTGRQTEGQVLMFSSLQVGNGTEKTYFKSTTQAIGTPRAYSSSADSLEIRRYNGGDSSLFFDIYASANDTIDMSASIFAAPERAYFRLNASSSTSATYDFAGLVVTGADVVGQDGITFNRATFSGCGQIDLNDGGLDTATVTNSLDTPAVITGDPAAITDSSFTSAGSGHAIEFESTGTFDFTGNSFSGYGADTTTDASLYNNSGGAITLTLGSGDSTPTYRNGASASTTINAPAVNISVNSYTAGSRVQIYNTTTATEIYNDTPAGTSYDYSVTSEASNNDTIRIRVTKLGETPWTANATFSSSTGASVLVEPTTDVNYDAYGIDGSTVTEYTWDNANSEIEVNESATFSAEEMYAWYNYYVTTSAGIANAFGILAPENLSNIELVGCKLDNVNSATIAQNDEIRLFRSDAALPVINPTTGGGGITLFSTGYIYTNNINTATNVITGDIADVPTASENAAAVADQSDIKLTNVLVKDKLS